MKKYTNKYNFPQPIVDAITGAEYTKGDAQISVTGLLQPPRKMVLCRQHADEIVKDVSDELDALLGTAIHAIIEKKDKSGVAERRLYMEAEGLPGVVWKIKGGMDAFNEETKELSDYKTTSVFKVKNGLPEEWEEQLNIYAELLRSNGISLNSACIWAFLKDWRPGESMNDSSYPPVKLIRLDVPIWPVEKIRTFIRHRLSQHQMAEMQLPECSDEERWATDPKFALMAKGRKSAVKLFDSEAAAKLVMEGLDAKKGKIHSIVKRPGEQKRCGRWCDAAPFCEQYQKILKQGENDE